MKSSRDYQRKLETSKNGLRIRVETLLSKLWSYAGKNTQHKVIGTKEKVKQGTCTMNALSSVF